MIPVPAELLELYPSPPDAPVLGRPWWRQGTSSDNLIRVSAGIKYRAVVGTVDGVGGFLSWEEVSRRVAEMDQRFPLPHPGFRVGQVWATLFDGPYVVLITEDTGRWFADSNGDRHYRNSKALPLAGWFLLADPCCPHLAPWAPAEGK